MASDPPGDPLDDAQYLRGESRRLLKIIKTLSDPDTKKELAAHSLYLAQRAESLERLKEDPAVIRMNVERYRTILASDMSDTERRGVQGLLDGAEQALDGPRTLRELAAWYRGFAERAGSPAIWQARLRMADDLDAEARRIERRLHELPRDQPTPP